MPLTIRPLTSDDYLNAESVVKTGFSKKMGIEDPDNFMSGASHLCRFLMDPDGVFGAENDGSLIGANISTTWGSFGYFGPLAVLPDYWGKGVAQRLLVPVMESFEKRNVTLAGLFTFANSPQHVHLYKKFGFMPRFLTAVMSKRLDQSLEKEVRSWRFSDFGEQEQIDFLESAKELTDGIYDGLDVNKEIRIVETLGIGDTIFIGGETLDGFAICHYGKGSEAKTGTLYIKFAAVRLTPSSTRLLSSLLIGCESAARQADIPLIVAGVNTARDAAYECMFNAGFRTDYHGVAMQRPNEPGFCRPDAFVLDDWR